MLGLLGIYVVLTLWNQAVESPNLEIAKKPEVTDLVRVLHPCVGHVFDVCAQ